MSKHLKILVYILQILSWWAPSNLNAYFIQVEEEAGWRMSLEFYCGVCVCAHTHARVCMCVYMNYILRTEMY